MKSGSVADYVEAFDWDHSNATVAHGNREFRCDRALSVHALIPDPVDTRGAMLHTLIIMQTNVGERGDHR